VGPRRNEGSQHLRHQAAGSRDHSGRRRGHLLWPRIVRGRGEGPRVASTSRSTRSMLPGAQGAGAAAIGDSTLRAPPGAGPRRVKALEVPGAARSATPCIGAPMHRGHPAPGIHWAGTFALFLLPGGRPRRFVPEPDPAAAEKSEGSMLEEESEGEVVLEEEGEVSEASRRLHL
jgi:hypothetical protein